jgi:UDP-N-acetylglucosamine--N-acetylmuramyl-(pentapeptide) pyrophosphoryl-undecaprenol N-acetylglucosamine transferase
MSTSILTVALAAGGTGGHLFPAESLARELKNRGHRVELVSDDRVADFASNFPADKIHIVTSGTVTGGSILGKIKGVISLGKGILECRGLMRKINPQVIVGFGGYPTVPPVLAASMQRVPVVLHEQNAVMGRANRFLSKRANSIATGFDIGAGFVHVGNPVREAVLTAATLPTPEMTTNGIINLLVFGGSQGARIMSDVLPPAIGMLSSEHRKRLHITQQARDEDLLRVKNAYATAGVANDCSPFFKDMPTRIAKSHLVIARSGASTVAELAVIGRASILVPLPGSLDQDQAANAAMLAKDGGAEIMMQANFTPRALAERLTAILSHPAQLLDMAAKAKAVGISDAASRLANLVEKVAAHTNPAKPDA